MKSQFVGGKYKSRTAASAVAAAVAFGMLLVPMMIGSSAGASPRLSSASTICALVNDPTGSCVTTTSGATTVPPSITIGTVGLQTASTPKGSSSLAFSGTDIALLVLLAALLILIGYAIVRVNKQRRHVR